ncbi:MAG: DUF3604 domain-containing protein [Chloroflexi bacterium]|nr:DUF3604 domain-containing protein [Chloroflexota bacterium]
MNSDSRRPPPQLRPADAAPRPFSGIIAPFDSKLLGHAWIDPREPVAAGKFGTWRVTFVCGKAGMDDGAHIRICERQVCDWERPQFDRPADSGYTTAETDGEAEVELAWFETLNERPFRRTLQVTIANGSLRPGERVVVTYGDRSGGGPGRRAQTFREPQSEFQVLADPFGAQRYFPVADHPYLGVFGDLACAIELRCGSQFLRGEAIALHVRLVDKWGNSDEQASARVELAADSPVRGLPAEIEFTPADAGAKVVSGISVPAAGTLRFRASSPGLAPARSNPVHVLESLPRGRRVRWGDMHGQSRESVGTLDAADYFRFARDDAFVEFVGHQANDFQITNEFLARLGQLTAALHQPGRFVPFFGWEWSGNTTTGGDRNVHFLADSGPLHRSSHALLREVDDAADDACPVSELHELLAGRRDVLLVPHVGGRYANLDFHDPSLEPVVELHSAHGTFEWLGRDARARGLKVGYLCGSDVHVGRPGAARPAVKAGEDGLGVTGGLAAVVTDELSREAIFEALRQRRCYGTTGVRILVSANANSHPIGADVPLAPGVPLSIAGFVDGTAPIQRIDLLRDWEPLESLRPRRSADSKRLRITWSGAASRGRRRSVLWSGRARVAANRILSVEGVGFDHPAEGIDCSDGNQVRWTSVTEGDMDGVELELADTGGLFEFDAGGVQFELDLDRMGDCVHTHAVGEIERRVQIERVTSGGPELVEFDWEIDPADLCDGGYHLRIVQSDCNCAWTSPFYVTGVGD